MTKTEKAVQWMEQTANNPLHGYDQKYRWGERGDYDCSSAVITAWDTAGVPVKFAGASYTGNMLSAFKKCGFDDVTKLVNLKSGTGLLRGDVLLNRRSHTAIYIGRGQLVQASINEKGTTTGGIPGDQTGKEFLVRSYYNYPWDYVLRYPEIKSQASKQTDYEIAKEVIRGLWGNGSERIRRLRKAGYNPTYIQKLVNLMILG